MKKLTAFLLTLCLLLSLTACGGASQSAPAAAADRYMMEEAAEAPAMEMQANGLSADTASASQAGTALPESRKWIVTVNMTAETEALDELLAALDQQISALGGYVEDQRIYNGSSYANRRYRNANLTIRIPAEDVDAFTTQVGSLSNVVSNEKNLQDITLTYVSTESRLKALETEEARLLELMEQAETMADLLEIEARLTDVRYELENAASRLRLYDNQVDYATIYLYIEEVQQYTPVAEKTVWERITDGFGNSLENLGEGIVDFFVWVAVNSPYLALWAAVLTVAVLVIRRLRKPGKGFLRRKQKNVKPENEA